MSLFGELKRRNVFRVAAAYLAVAWLVVQIVETLFPVFGLGDAAIRFVVILLAIGFIPALIVAWAFELTPEGFRREADVDHTTTSARRMTKRLDRVLLVALALALGFFALDKFVLDPARDAEELETAREEAMEAGRAEARETVRDNSIAVLAFQDLSPTGDQAYFCDGLAIDLLNQLAGDPALRVTGKTSAFSFKGKDATIPEISEALNVGHVLEGSVSKAGDRIRISVQLVDARADTQLWSETYDRTLDDIFAIRDEISEQIMRDLTAKLAGVMPGVLRTEGRVYDLTLQARHLIVNVDGMEDVKRAAALIEEALAIDPDYVPALLESVYVNYDLMRWGQMSEAEQNESANRTMVRVLELDPDNGNALALVAWGRWEAERDMDGAARGFTRAFAAAPGDTEVMRSTAMFARSIGRHEESVALLERCVASDPLNLRCRFHYGVSLLFAGRNDEAVEAFERLHSLTGESGAIRYLVIGRLLQGQPERALAELDAAEEASPGPRMIAARAMVLHDLGRGEESATLLATLIDMWPELDKEGYYLIPEVQSWTGDIDAAFEWLARATDASERYGIYGYWFQRNIFLPVWRNLHGDPRWDEARERVEMSERQLAALPFEVALPE
jgi:TolB-like protein/Flp pilus assembly protein TadD